MPLPSGAVFRRVPDSQTEVSMVQTKLLLLLDHIPLTRYCIGSLRDNQRTRAVMLNLNWLRVEEVSWQWSVGRVTVPRLSTWYDVTWYDMTWHDGARCDMTWHDVTWRDITWYDMTWHDVPWRDMRYITYVAWRDMTWHDVTWRDMTWHGVKWRDIMRHNETWRGMTRRDVTQHDVTWRAIRISTQQEWILLHVRWLRYCRKTIKTFLGLKLFTGDS